MKSLDELKQIKERALEMKRIKEGQARVTITVGMATCGIAAGARSTMKAIMEYIRENNVEDVAVTQTGCNGTCEHEPVVDIHLKGNPKVTYGHLNAERVQKLMDQHVMKGEPIDAWVLSVDEETASS
ncbi:ferredoxin [candidate division KSB3 bacterium]|uniref:Ferredoxin n=1 Tax=candidate division KSB3 bacterium TaxID=2044937 RepID=A0A2G6E678_9BACT|nr:MAG: ferredoxin [candidate division KSB3 bacterium]PIE30004.1 MAG: ferredoxin [candidate division KSB3 bacterium]